MNVSSKKILGVIWGAVVAIFNGYIMFHFIFPVELSDIFNGIDWSYYIGFAVVYLIPPAIGYISGKYDDSIWKILLKPLLSIPINIAFYLLCALIGLFLYGNLATALVAILIIGALVGEHDEIIAFIVEL